MLTDNEVKEIIDLMNAASGKISDGPHKDEQNFELHPTPLKNANQDTNTLHSDGSRKPYFLNRKAWEKRVTFSKLEP